MYSTYSSNYYRVSNSKLNAVLNTKTVLICPFRYPTLLLPLTHHSLAPLSYLTRPRLWPLNSIAVKAIVDVGGVLRISRLNVARDGDRQDPLPPPVSLTCTHEIQNCGVEPGLRIASCSMRTR